MSSYRALGCVAIVLAIAIVSSPGLSEVFDCRKNEPAAAPSECAECVDVPGGFDVGGTMYYSKSCVMTTYPVDQQCTIETNEDGIICWTTTANCGYFGGAMKAWKDIDCSDDPKNISGCDTNFQFIAAGWQDQGEVPICPPE